MEESGPSDLSHFFCSSLPAGSQPYTGDLGPGDCIAPPAGSQPVTHCLVFLPPKQAPSIWVWKRPHQQDVGLLSHLPALKTKALLPWSLSHSHCLFHTGCVTSAKSTAMAKATLASPAGLKNLTGCSLDTNEAVPCKDRAWGGLQPSGRQQYGWGRDLEALELSSMHPPANRSSSITLTWTAWWEGLQPNL